MVSGYPIASLQGKAQPNPITAISRGNSPNTFIVSAYRCDTNQLNVIMKNILPYLIPYMYPRENLDYRFRCNARQASSSYFWRPQNEDMTETIPVNPIIHPSNQQTMDSQLNLPHCPTKSDPSNTSPPPSGQDKTTQSSRNYESDSSGSKRSHSSQPGNIKQSRRKVKQLHVTINEKDEEIEFKNAKINALKQRIAELEGAIVTETP